MHRYLLWIPSNDLVHYACYLKCIWGGFPYEMRYDVRYRSGVTYYVPPRGVFSGFRGKYFLFALPCIGMGDSTFNSTVLFVCHHEI
jgi:hypothetical protein